MSDQISTFIITFSITALWYKRFAIERRFFNHAPFFSPPLQNRKKIVKESISCFNVAPALALSANNVRQTAGHGSGRLRQKLTALLILRKCLLTHEKINPFLL